MISKIELKGIRFYAFHGTGEQERMVGNHFVVDVLLAADLSRAVESDSVDDTINYATIYNIVKQEMLIPSNLLEHAAGRILKSLKQSLPQIEEIEIRLAKTIPPLGAELDNAAVILHERYVR